MTVQPNSLVLVAVVNHPRDLEIARLLGWYRIPLRTAPKVIAVDYLAFYQTGAFGDTAGAFGGGRWRIHFLAPVRGHELVTRLELFRDEPDHPRAREEYYKIQLGSMVMLPQPILAEEWRRITFFYTTGEYIIQAQTIKDLIVPSEERELLWKALHERAAQGQTYLAPGFPELDLNAELISLLLGIKETEESYQPGNQKSSGA